MLIYQEIKFSQENPDKIRKRTRINVIYSVKTKRIFASVKAGLQGLVGCGEDVIVVIKGQNKIHTLDFAQ